MHPPKIKTTTLDTIRWFSHPPSRAMVFPRLDLQLDVSIVLPLIDYIRVIANEAPLADTMPLSADPEIRTLLDLFTPDFENYGHMSISGSSEAGATVRACSQLRLHLRHTALNAIDDEALQSVKWQEKVCRQPHRHRAEMAYLFLAELQGTLLNQRVAPSGNAPVQHDVLRWGKRLIRRWRNLTTKEDRAVNEPEATASHTVWVLNDPVNTMPYVTAVFEAVLAMASHTAEIHMREVHETSRSAVWSGSSQGADRISHALQSWHLAVEVLPSLGDGGEAT